MRLRGRLVDGFPDASEWERAEPIGFDRDWQGRNADLGRSTGVRLLWSPDEIYIRFVCRYRELFVFEKADRPDGRRDHLWDRDVAETFLQPDRFGEKYYSEFEVSPNGFWIDLAITPSADLQDLRSGLRRSVQVAASEKVWTAILAIPIKSVTSKFDPQQPWRANFFRCEGRDPNRAYLSWRPTNTPEPNFHVPQQFGSLQFAK
jgi:hypothetical protein